MSKGYEKRIGEFAELLPQLQAVEVIGLARLLNVKVMTQTVAKDPKKIPPRKGQEILEDLIVQFGTLRAKQQKDILKLMRLNAKINKKEGLAPSTLSTRGETNGASAKN